MCFLCLCKGLWITLCLNDAMGSNSCATGADQGLITFIPQTKRPEFICKRTKTATSNRSWYGRFGLHLSLFTVFTFVQTHRTRTCFGCRKTAHVNWPKMPVHKITAALRMFGRGKNRKKGTYCLQWGTKKSLGTLPCFVHWKGTRRHFTTLSQKERNPRGHFTTFCPLGGHPRKCFIIFF